MVSSLANSNVGTIKIGDLEVRLVRRAYERGANFLGL